MENCTDPAAVPGGRGNVGRIALSALEFNHSSSKYSLLAQLLAYGLVYRVLAAVMLGVRLSRSRSLREEKQAPLESSSSVIGL